MGVFACSICGNPAAWNSVFPGGMSKHDCPGPPPKPDGGPPTCGYCDKADPTWSAADLSAGKRRFRDGCGVEYHCTSAFYLAS